MAQLVKNLPAMQETWIDPWLGKTPWRRERLPTPVFWPGEFKESDMTERLSFSFSLSLGKRCLFSQLLGS